MAVRTPFNRRRSGSKPAANPQGETRASVNHEELPRLPHEHDESADSQESPPRADMQQAARDVKRGLVDTDRGPVADSTYRRLK